MLHIESWHGSKKGFYPLIIIGALFLFVACNRKPSNPNINISTEAFSDLKTPSFVFSSDKIRKNIAILCKSEKATLVAERHTHDYYLDNGPFLWIHRHGVDSRVDTLMKNLAEIDSIGFAPSSFYIEEIKQDLERMHNLDFDSGSNSVDNVLARLEFHLTKVFLKYTTGQRFGFVNPKYILNRIDTLDNSPTNSPVFRRLFDVNIQRPDDNFFANALQYIYKDSVGIFLKRVQPSDTLYYKLRSLLNQPGQSEESRTRIICNMERCRWRESAPLNKKGKHIVVNIPAFHLYAFDTDSMIDMRIGCGTRKNKTPILTSGIERMDVNPIWNIPMSIVRKEVSPHAGNVDYFERNNYYIVNRETGERLEPEDVSTAMLKSGKYRVSQKGGEGNSLGRIVFRFPNNFSVFLHDTSSKSVFTRTNRGVSHGCVRVERPFDLAVFLLTEPDEWLLDRLRISMDIKPETERGLKYIEDENNSRNLVGSLQVKPSVPLEITYYTLFPDEKGRITPYPDVYGYDEIILQTIKPFLK